MENKETPNSHEYLRRDTSRSWSDLHIDLLSLVFERLSFTNFRRAKSVCSSWYLASRQSVPTKNQIHWLILFPKEKNNNNNNSCVLFNPEEKQNLYKTHDLGVEFAKSVCMATYKSWFLMQDSQYNLFIMNLFTRETIDLPSVELFWNDYKLRIGFANLWSKYIVIRSPRFWIDDKTKDYVVLWGLRNWCVVYSKKGDTLWNEIPEFSDCRDMVFKDHKLYILSYSGIFKIFDFSGEIPQETFQCDFLVGRLYLFIPNHSTVFHTSHLVVTVTGEVLKVEKWWTQRYRTLSFRVFKIYSSGKIMKKPEWIKSLDDELILLDQGITVLAIDTDRLSRNSIYLSGTCDCEKNIFHYNLKTRETVRLHPFDHSSINFSRSKWFVPCFTHT